MILETHCTQNVFKLQILKTAHSCVGKPIPFANGDPKRFSAFERDLKQLKEMESNGVNRVLHEFSLAILEVRGVGTSVRKTVIQCV